MDRVSQSISDNLLMLATAEGDQTRPLAGVRPPPLMPAPHATQGANLQQFAPQPQQFVGPQPQQFVGPQPWAPQPQPSPAGMAAAGGFNMADMRNMLAEVGRTMQPPADTRVRLPEYDGSSDVEMFIETFLGIMGACQWSPATALLQLRSCLKGSACDAARGTDLMSALTSLRSRFTVTSSQAHDRLQTLRYDGRQNLHEFAAEIERLTRFAFYMVPPEYQGEMIIDNFRNSLNNCRLQQHLLTVPAKTVQDLVVAAQKYLLVGETASRSAQYSRPRVANLDEFAPVQEPSPASDVSSMLGQLMQMVQANSQAISHLSQAQASSAAQAGQATRAAPAGGSATGGARTGPPGPCFRCKGPHLKRNCPLLQHQKPGNGAGSQ